MLDCAKGQGGSHENADRLARMQAESEAEQRREREAVESVLTRAIQETRDDHYSAHAVEVTLSDPGMSMDEFGRTGGWHGYQAVDRSRVDRAIFVRLEEGGSAIAPRYILSLHSGCRTDKSTAEPAVLYDGTVEMHVDARDVARLGHALLLLATRAEAIGFQANATAAETATTHRILAEMHSPDDTKVTEDAGNAH